MNPVLIIAAHPDDEVLGVGGTISSLAQQGFKVDVLWLTNGVGARNGTTQKDVDCRSKASQQACKILGVNESFNLDLPDNALDSISLLEIVKKIETIVIPRSYSTVFTHHGGDLNIDHRIAYQATLTCFRQLPASSCKKIYTYEVLSGTNWQPLNFLPFIPNTFVDISHSFSKKEKAALIYEKELREFPHTRSIISMESLAKYRGSTVGLNLAEAFCLERSLVI